MTKRSSAVRIGSQTPRLSQQPARAVASAGDDAIEWAESIGFDSDEGRGYYVLDEWQKFCIRGLLSEDASARLCALVALIIVARQNGKNVILEIVELYAFYVLDLPYILHTAHLAETTADHMENLWAAIQSDEALASITRRVVANGKERIYRTDRRCQIRFRTRSKKTGRGGSPQMVAFDEALHLTDKQVSALLPSLAAQSMRGDAPLLIYTSSAPYEDSDVLRRVRQSIVDGGIPDAFFAEFSAHFEQFPGESMLQAMKRLADDREAWYASNPGMGVRIAPDWVQANERSTMSLEAFLIERLSVVFEIDGEASGYIPRWVELADRDSKIAAGDMWALAVSPVELGPQWASIGIAGRRADGRFHVEVIDHRAGTWWIVERAAEIFRAKKLPIRVHTQGPEGAFIAQLVEAGVKVDEVSTVQVGQATGQLIEAANQIMADDRPPALHHLGQSSLDKALKHAIVRTTVEGASIWDARSEVEITPLKAVTVAVGGVPAAKRKAAAWVLVD